MSPPGAQRIKVLMLVDMLSSGGAERAAAGLAVSLPQDRFEVTVVATRRGEGALLEQLSAAGVRYEILGRRSRYDMAPLRRLSRMLREGGFHVLHAHKFGSNLWGSVVGRMSGVPVVVAHEHSWSYIGQPVRRLLDGQVIGRLADVMVAVSTRDRERMTSVEGIPPTKTIYIPNAFVSRDYVQDAGADVRAELGLPASVPVIATLAMLRPEKRLDLLIEAFAVVSRSVPDAQLVIGGDGWMQEEWDSLAGRLGVRDRLHWLGMREDVEAVLAAADVAALSSEREGMPLFAFECMATRTPLVATDVGGLRDVFPGGEGALLVPPGSSEALADGLLSLLGSPPRRAEMAEAAHARLPEFSAERSAERVGELYERLLAARGVRVPVREPASAAPA